MRFSKIQYYEWVNNFVVNGCGKFLNNKICIFCSAAPSMNMSKEDVILVSGEKLRLNVPIFGHPTPTPTWTRDEQSVKDHVKVNNI